MGEARGSNPEQLQHVFSTVYQLPNSWMYFADSQNWVTLADAKDDSRNAMSLEPIIQRSQKNNVCEHFEIGSIEYRMFLVS